MADDQSSGNETVAFESVACDFLIVGAGSSGCVLASRLVRQGLKVLLVEKGPADTKKMAKLIRKPGDWLRQAASGNAVSELFLTVPQASLGNRRIHAFRGRGGGGSSNVNAALYCRGSKKDYEEHWPWELKDIERSFKTIESELTLEDHESTGTIASSCDRMLEEIGFEHSSSAEQEEPNAENDRIEPTWTKEGLGGCPLKRTTTRGGERQSAWAAFISPVTAMPNFRVKDDATVSRVIIEGGRAVGIEVLEVVPKWKGGGTRVRRLRLANESAEIIICCGVFRTPKLLMLSGVGPRKHLEEKGVPVVFDMPQVGKNLQDHVAIPTMNFSKQSMSEADYVDGAMHGLSFFSRALPSSGTASGNSESGAGSDGSGKGGAAPSVANSPPSAVVGFLYTEGSNAAKNLPIVVSMLYTKPGFLAGLARAIMIVLCWIATWLTPICRVIRGTRGALLLVTTVKSRGTVRLASADAAAPPLIDPAYLSHREDQQAACECWRAFRKAKRETATGKAVFGAELLPGKRFNYGNDDESFLRFAREHCLSFFHAVGTCRMGKGVEDSVVSSDSLRVHGISGLRVADSSIAPRIPSAPTQAMAMMIGDRAASIALRDRFAKDQVQTRWLEAASKSLN